MERRLHDLAHRLERQGATIPQYLAAIGQDQETFVDGVREGATAGVRADLALRAVVAQEQIEPSEDEIDVEVGTPRGAARAKARKGAQGARQEGSARGGTL